MFRKPAVDLKICAIVVLPQEIFYNVYSNLLAGSSVDFSFKSVSNLFRHILILKCMFQMSKFRLRAPRKISTVENML